jgi:serine/threonine protein phosphatase PrpC
MASPELDSSAISHIGPVREENQDAIRLPDTRLPPETGQLYAVADGMGGYANGALASRLALEALFDTVYENNAASIQTALRRGVEKANLQVYKASQRLESGRMGTTLTAACISGNTLHIAHVGDSRLYLVRDATATILTNDHTTVGDLVRMRVLTPEKIRTHAQRSILTKGVGLTMIVQPDVTQVKLQENDCLILCSDGLWSVIEDAEFAQLAGANHSAERLGQSLIDLALERETDDNISVIAIYVRQLAANPNGNHNGHGPGWARSLVNFLPEKVNHFLGRNGSNGRQH